MKAVLLTGWGLVAQAIAHAAQDRGLAVSVVSRHTGVGEGRALDLAVPTPDLTAVVHRLRPDAVVHTAAMTSVIQCQRDPAGAFRANVAATQHVLDAAYGIEATVALISTDWVFDGAGGGYVEDDLRAPLNVYGLTKAHAEDLVLAADGLVVRGTYVGQRPDGSPGLVERLLDSSVSPRVPRCKCASPLWVGHAAPFLLDLLHTGARGRLHLGSANAIAWRDLAERVRGGPVGEVELDDGVLRPSDTSLDTTRAQGILGRPFPTAAETLDAMLSSPPLRGAPQ